MITPIPHTRKARKLARTAESHADHLIAVLPADGLAAIFIRRSIKDAASGKLKDAVIGAANGAVLAIQEAHHVDQSVAQVYGPAFVVTIAKLALEAK